MEESEEAEQPAPAEEAAAAEVAEVAEPKASGSAGKKDDKMAPPGKMRELGSKEKIVKKSEHRESKSGVVSSKAIDVLAAGEGSSTEGFGGLGVSGAGRGGGGKGIGFILADLPTGR
jgi:hypothetical protein